MIVLQNTNTFDSKGERNQILSEEETPVEESSVRQEFSPEFVTHIINRREFNHYNEVPQDIEIWIGKHKIRRVRYLPHREKSLIDYPLITRKLLNHLKSIFKKRKKGTKVRFYLSTKKVLANKKTEYDKLGNDNS